jgi:hypothetical protein
MGSSREPNENAAGRYREKAELGRERRNKPTTGIATYLESAETNPLRCLSARLKIPKQSHLGDGDYVAINIRLRSR